MTRIRAVAAATLRGEAVPGAPDRAAVAMILREGPAGAEVLLIRRAERDGDPWSGHMGLPGGRWAPGDASLADTARRETLEEVGLDLETSSVELGSLATIPAIARGRRTPLTITPYLFVSTTSQVLRLNDEVDDALWVPLGSLLDGSAATTIEYESDGRAGRLPAWNVRGHVVWGLTHAMLGSLLEHLR
jgi:8-oxo-dGTP pyrophosphatase MutT (NUDIX family)